MLTAAQAASERATGMKAQRNDPCPCGSGKKFKKCCQLQEPASPAVPAPAAIAKALDAALAHHQAGRLTEAEQAYRAILAQQPKQMDALHLLGVVCLQRGDFSNAITLIESAIRIGGPLRDFLYNLGNALRGVRRDAEAVAAYSKILETAPDDVDALNNLGLACRGAGRMAEALSCFERARGLAPHDPDLLGNLGLVLADMNRGEEAITFYRQALQLNPALPEVLNNLGSSLQNAGDTEGAIAAYRQALHFRPDYPEAHSNLIFSLDFVEAGGVAGQQAERCRWADRFAARIVPATGHANSLEPARRLRIGYLSPDFRHHSAAYAFAPLILAHDPQNFEIYCYSNSPVSDDLTERFRQNAEHWRPVYGLSDAEAAQLIRTDGIDILVDLAAHSRNNRLGIMAHRPAPVQASGWGHANGTGLATIDYLFSDPVYVPPAEAAHYREKILYLPCVIGYLVQTGAPELTPLPALHKGHVTFGSFSRMAKISPEVLTLWAELMQQVPGSRILFKAPELNSPGQCSLLLAHMQANGIAPERIDMLPGSPWQAHVASIGSVDIALDPYPHGGGISVLDCLWMGVPVLAMERPIPAGRVAASILKVHGLDDWIATDKVGFLSMACRHAADLEGLAMLRSGLRARLAASPAGDARSYAAAVEGHYRNIWQDFTRAACGR